MKVGIDLDGVIADFDTNFRNYLNYRLKKTVLKTTNYDYSLVYHVSPETIKQLLTDFENVNGYYSLRPYPDAKKFLKTLDSLFGIEWYYVTTRPLTAEEQTKKWLRKNRFPKKEIIFVNDKKTYYEKTGYDLVVDDDPRIKSDSYELILIDHAYNKKAAPNYRAFNLLQALDIIIEKNRKF